MRLWFKYTLPRLLRQFFGWVGRGFKPVPPKKYNNVKEFCEDLCGWPDTGDLVQAEKDASRRVRKDTACGAWLQFIQEKPMNGSPVGHYGVYGIFIRSIVEGVDAFAEADILWFPFTEKQFDEAVKCVEEEVERIWNETHGCPHCWTNTTCPEDGPCELCDVPNPVYKPPYHDKNGEVILGDAGSGVVDPDCLSCDGGIEI